MKTLYITGGSNIVIDPEANTADRINISREAINNMYLVKEPMHVVYGYGEYKRELDATEGDIIVTFYHNRFKNEVIVVKNKDWFENLIDYEKREQEEKERWACEQCNKKGIDI